MGKSDPLLGGKDKKAKIPNELKKEAKNARTRPITDPPSTHIDEFGDGTILSKDWRLIPCIVCEVIKQTGEICWAIVLARLLQAVYNLSQDGNEQNYKTFSHQDLVQHLKPDPKKKGKKSSSLALSNIKNALKHMKSEGLLKIKSSGKTTAGTDIGNKEKWEFTTMRNADVDFIKRKVDESPIGIAFELGSEFYGIKKDIYTARGTDMVEGEKISWTCI